MAGLLSGLEQFGLSNLESMDLYETQKKPEEGGEGGQAAAHVVQEQDFLFDPTSPLNKEQVKEMFCILEKRFAENTIGDVKILKGSIIAGSVMSEISIPALERNTKVNLCFIDKL